MKAKKAAKLVKPTPAVQRVRAVAAEDHVRKTLADGRRVKIRTKDGVRELTQKELILLLTRRALVTEDVQAGRLPRYVKCWRAGCALLVSRPRSGLPRRYCDQHRREVRQRAFRDWREKNLKSLREAQRAWRAKNADHLRENKRRWRSENGERNRENKRRWYAENRDRDRARQRAAYAKRRRAAKETTR